MQVSEENLSRLTDNLCNIAMGPCLLTLAEMDWDAGTIEGWMPDIRKHIVDQVAEAMVGDLGAIEIMIQCARAGREAAIEVHSRTSN